MISHDLPTKDIDSPQSLERSLGGRTDEPEPGDGRRPESELTHGELVGRYTVLDCLGRGGMGVVYRAYDPQLDRNVAVKLLRRGRSSVQADLRLLREAQTLAKLKHPNVVAVYDAGLTPHGVFIAMELLSGKTINEWLEARRRSVREIVEVFRAAGRGLVAAHRAGFVHRDFKPSNVLVEDDGSVRVLDFGLAHAVQGPPPDEDDPFVSGPYSAPQPGLDGTGPYPSSPRELFVTHASTLVGTPAFMAPEQLLGRRGDHRSEQFAFATSLYVALYDRAPPWGETYDERRASLEQGLRISERELERSASGERVPPRIRQVIVRGLARDPGDRFASMEALLVKLEEPPSRGRLVAIAGFTLLAGFGVGAMVFDEPANEPCLDPAAALGRTWGPDDRAALAAAFSRADDPAVARVRPRVEAQLDEYASEWVRMYGESCHATFVRREQSERLFDQRMRCLERRRNRLRSTIDALLEAESPGVLLQRTVVPFQLPGLDPCADLEAVASEQPLPEDARVREAIARLRERIDEADTRKDSGDFERGLQVAEAAVEEARSLGYAPVLAEALTSLGRLQSIGASARDAETTLREAVMVAAEVGDARTEAVAWVELLFAYVVQGRVEVGVEQELGARSAVARAGDEVVRSWLLNNLGVLYSEHKQPEQSRQYLREALEAKRSALGEHHVDVAISWYNLGNSLADYDALDDAQEAFERARAIFEATLGETHPMVHYAQSGLCRVQQAQGHAAAAVKLCEEELAYFEEVAQSAMWRSRVGFTLAQAQWDAGMPEQARRTAERAREHASPQDARRIAKWLEDPQAFAREGERARARRRTAAEGSAEATDETETTGEAAESATTGSGVTGSSTG